MPSLPSTPAAFQSVYTNPSASSKYFMYLGDHGLTLAAGASYTADGDLEAYWRAHDKRKFQTLTTDLANGVVVKTQIPAGGGAVAYGTSVTGYDTGLGAHRTVLTLTNLAVAMTDATTNGAYGGVTLLTLPEGVVSIVGAVTNLTVTASGTPGISATATLKHALGTVQSTTSDTLSSTLANIVPSTNTTLAAYTGAAKGISSSTPGLFDGTASAVKVWLNLGVADAGSASNDTVTVSGTVTVVWSYVNDK